MRSGAVAAMRQKPEDERETGLGQMICNLITRREAVEINVGGRPFLSPFAFFGMTSGLNSQLRNTAFVLGKRETRHLSHNLVRGIGFDDALSIALPRRENGAVN